MNVLLKLLPAAIQAGTSIYDTHTKARLHTESLQAHVQLSLYTQQTNLEAYRAYTQDRAHQREMIIQAMRQTQDPTQRQALIKSLTTPLELRQLSPPQNTPFGLLGTNLDEE